MKREYLIFWPCNFLYCFLNAQQTVSRLLVYSEGFTDITLSQPLMSGYLIFNADSCTLYWRCICPLSLCNEGDFAQHMDERCVLHVSANCRSRLFNMTPLSCPEPWHYQHWVLMVYSSAEIMLMHWWPDLACFEEVVCVHPEICKWIFIKCA